MILLAALLLAAPERVVIVAKKADRPGFLAKAAGKLNSAVHRLYEKEDAEVGRGNALAAQGDPNGALREYDKVRTRLPEDARLAFDRASALLKLDPSKAAAMAASEANRALQQGDAALKPMAAYDLALATEAMGRPDEAMRAYAVALGLDPDDRDSKVNLELLLKSQEERKKKQAGQPQENKQKQQGEKQQPDKSKGEQQQKEQQKQAGEQEKKKQEQSQDKGPDQSQPKPEEKKQQAREEQKPADRSEAERLLDALRASEKNLQLWRFAKEKTKETRRSEPEKDW